MSLLTRALQVPLRGANMVAGGNATDRLLAEGSPLIKRMAPRLWKVSGKERRRILKRYGTKKDQQLYRRERAKTLAARAAALAGGGYWLKRKKDAPQDDFYYR